MTLTKTPAKNAPKRKTVPLREFRLDRQITGRFATDQPRAANDLTPCPVRLTVLSGGALYNYVPTMREWGWDFEYTRFVFDLSTLKYNSTLLIDWNHDADQVIGSVAAPTINERGELTTSGSLVPFAPKDRAAEVAYKAQFVPFGISPTVAFDNAERIDVKLGESINVNGREYAGPIAVFKNAEVLGVSICPYPTDSGTNVSTFDRKKQVLQYAKTLTKQRIFQMATKKGKFEDVPATDAAIEEVIEKVLADVLDEAAAEVANTELEDAAAPDDEPKPADEAQLEDAAAADEEEEKKKDEEKPASALRRLARALFSTEEPKKEEDEAELEDAAATDEEEKKKDENAQLKKVLKAALKTRLKKRLLTGLAKPRETPTIQTLQSEIADLTKIVAKLAAAKIAESGESHPASSAHGDAGKGYLAATTAKLERMVR